MGLAIILPPPEEYLKNAFKLFATGKEKEKALVNVHFGLNYLENLKKASAKYPKIKQIEYMLAGGYQIAALVYLWNNQPEDAFEIENKFMQFALEDYFAVAIEQYFLLLFIKDEKVRLKKLFKSLRLQRKYNILYDIYISTYIDKEYQLRSNYDTLVILDKIKRGKLLWL